MAILNYPAQTSRNNRRKTVPPQALVKKNGTKIIVYKLFML